MALVRSFIPETETEATPFYTFKTGLNADTTLLTDTLTLTN